MGITSPLFSWFKTQLIEQSCLDALRQKKVKRHSFEMISAAAEGDIETVKQCLDSDVNVNASNIRGLTALCSAVKSRQFWVVKLLLSRRDINVNYEDPANSTALTYAVRNGDLILSDMLLKHHVKQKYKDQALAESIELVNEARSKKNNIQAFDVQFAMIELLLRNGANPEIEGLQEVVKVFPSLRAILNACQKQLDYLAAQIAHKAQIQQMQPT